MLKNNFCSSPWFNLKITSTGEFHECRWYRPPVAGTGTIKNTSIMQFYNSRQMRSLRSSLLNGERRVGCAECYYEDSYNKLSGRVRQLLKSGVRLPEFELTLRSSPHYPMFLHSLENNGHSEYYPVDLQVDLGNVCNSACIMCSPQSSSRLQTDYQKLQKINPVLFNQPPENPNWTHDPALVEKFIDELLAIPEIKYIHFLGGETLYDETFYLICERLIAANRAKDIIVGTTTNGTIYSPRLEKLIAHFKEFHLGVSIESVTELNDYIRYPSIVTDILANLDQFLKLREKTNLYVSLRVTPNVFTISQIDQLFEYMIKHQVTAESCNILVDPASLRIELLPEEIRQETIGKLDSLVNRYQLTKTDVVNVRRSDLIPEVISNFIIDYQTFLSNYTPPLDIDQQRQDLVAFIKAFESIRKNSILTYLPGYEKFLRTYGY